MPIVSKQRFSSQRGEGESSLFIMVMIGSVILSVLVALLGWVKDTKDARVRGRVAQEEAVEAYEPPGYRVSYMPMLCGSEPCSE